MFVHICSDNSIWSCFILWVSDQVTCNSLVMFRTATEVTYMYAEFIDNLYFFQRKQVGHDKNVELIRPSLLVLRKVLIKQRDVQNWTKCPPENTVNMDRVVVNTELFAHLQVLCRGTAHCQAMLVIILSPVVIIPVINNWGANFEKWSHFYWRRKVFLKTKMKNKVHGPGSIIFTIQGCVLLTVSQHLYFLRLCF